MDDDFSVRGCVCVCGMGRWDEMGGWDLSKKFSSAQSAHWRDGERDLARGGKGEDVGRGNKQKGKKKTEFKKHVTQR